MRHWLISGLRGVPVAVAASLVAGFGHAVDLDTRRPLGNASQLVIPQARGFGIEESGEPIQIESVAAKVEIRERTAATTLEIRLKNTRNRPEQAVLLLPVPDGAVVSTFAFDGPAPEATAVVMQKDEARALYDAVVAQVLDPALLEFAGYNLVRSSVFPVDALSAQAIRITYEHLLSGDGGRVDYVLPRSESLDRQRLWSIAVDVRSDHAISTVYSPSHEITSARRSAQHVTVRSSRAATLDPGPFRLSYLQEHEGVAASFFTYPDPAVGGGYFLLMAGLPAIPAPWSSRMDRELTLVIDRSGSMAGGKLDQVRAAALQIVEGLEDGEAFNIIDYSSSVSLFAPRPVIKGSVSAAAAREYLTEARPGGGTNIHDALLEALRQPPTPSTLPIVLFLTDGLPTIGKTREAAIRDMVTAANVHGRRVFTLGVGGDVNVPLLDRIATLTRAAASYVLPDQDVEQEVARVFRRLEGPVFANATLATTDRSGRTGSDFVSGLIPGELPDLFAGDQLILLGRYRDEEPVVFELRGDFQGREREFRFELDPTRATTENAFVPRLWASRRIAVLIDQVRQAGASTVGVTGVSLTDDPRHPEIIEEILDLSTDFGVLTEYTAFLATEGTDLSDWNALQAGCSRELDERAVRTRSGIAALNQAVNYENQKTQSVLNYRNRYVDRRLEEVELTAVQHVRDRAFFRKGNRWIDARLLAVHVDVDPDEVIMIGSDEHLELVRRFVGEGRQGVLSLAGEILIEVDGRAVLVTDGC